MSRKNLSADQLLGGRYYSTGTPTVFALHNMSQLTREELTLLTVSEIRNLVQGKLTVSRAHHDCKDPLVDFVLTEASPELLASLHLAIDNKVAQKALVQERNLVERKRKRHEEQTSRRVAAK